MPPLSHPSLALLLAQIGPLLAGAIALGGALLCRAKGRRALLPVVAAVAVVVGWAAPLPWGTVWRAAAGTRSGPELLLLPGVVAAGLLLLAAWRRGWWERRASAGIGVFAGWWLAAALATRSEFWRVWAAVAVLAWLLGRVVGARPFRGLACALALWGGLMLVRGPAGWVEAAAVAAACWGGLLAAGESARMPAGLLAALVAATDLAAGRLARGGLNAVDLVCVAACGAPVAAAVLAPRLRRLGAFGPPLAGVAGAACAACLAWFAHRAIRS